MNWDILLKYINEETTTAEDAGVNNWLNEQAENKHLLNYLQKRREQLQQPLKQSDIHAQWVLLLDRIFEAPKDTAPAKPIRLYFLMGLAASLLLVSLLGWFFYQSGTKADSSRWLTLQTPANMRERITLPDGTLVYMAPNSKIRYTTTFGQNKRELQLSGEAFFDVKHNAARPFIIRTANKLAVTVLGTSFNIYTRSNHNTEVKVATGLVGVTNGKQTHFLKAGCQLSYNADNNKVTISAVAHNDAAALQNQSLFFKNNNADEIAQKLQRWYNIGVEVMPSARKHSRFSGEMKDTGIDNLMKGLCYATGLNYKYKNQQTIILF